MVTTGLERVVPEKKASWVFEASWEVCNKVGGIYTVIISKANQMIARCGSTYVPVGPYFSDKARGEFVEELPPQQFKTAFDELRREGIQCKWGKWLIKGQPNTILVDFHEFTYALNDYKKAFWDAYRIDSLGSSFYDYDEPFLWGIAVGRVLEKITAGIRGCVLHCHEWLAGSALLYANQHAPWLATVFTTHATILGRTLASAGRDVYALEGIDPIKEAYGFGIQAKHLTERTCAHTADVFTTVSEITGMEAEKLLGKAPDVLLLNGLDFSKFPTFEELTIKHSLYKRRIKESLVYYFFPYYTFDLDDTLIFFIAGRYEFHDKGIDVLIKALGRLNTLLKKENSSKTIVTFFWIPGAIRGIRHELLESKTFYDDITTTVDENMDDVRVRMLHSMVAGRNDYEKDLFDEQVQDELKKKLLKFKRSGIPPLSTHDLMNEQTDAILCGFNDNGLRNHEEDRVKVIFYPIYLSGADGLLDLNYYEGMMGGHLGVFPSYYEPWGYTPLEGAALGVASVTTDLAGFGRYVKKLGDDTKGIFVLPRYKRSEEEIVAALTQFMHAYCQYTKEERINHKLEARKVASYCDWKHFIIAYVTAHNLAVERNHA